MTTTRITQRNRIKPVRFPLGKIVGTQGAVVALRRAREKAVTYLARHAAGDWGEVDAMDNELALDWGDRLLSAYTTSVGEKLWIITEANRSATTVCLPEEY